MQFLEGDSCLEFHNLFIVDFEVPVLHHINIVVHVTAGVIALLVGMVSFASEKGSTRHAYAGRIFLSLMSLVLITAAVGVIFFRDRPFLALLTIQSFYMAASGYRATWYQEKGPGRVDLALVLVLFGCAGIFLAGFQNASIVWSRSIVYYTLAVLLSVGCYDLLRIGSVLRWKNAWIPEHFLKMTMAYGALFSAGLGTVLPDLGAYTQILPSIVATFLLLGVVWRFRKYFRANANVHTP